MANAGDASIKLLYPVNDGTFFTLDTLPPGTPYDVIANVEIGENLNENVDDFVLRVAIVNLSTASQVDIQEVKGTLTPLNNTEHLAEVRADFGPVQNTSPGDVLQAVASYRVNAGANFDISTALSATFVAE